MMKIEGVPLSFLSYTADALATRFSHETVPSHARSIFKEELSRYRAWRRTLFDLYLLETGSLADQDVIAGLMRIARLEGEESTATKLLILGHVLPEEMTISDLTYENALEIDKGLNGKKRPAFRNALYLLDRLRAAPLAAASTHLLPREVIGLLPPPSGHLYHAPLPPVLSVAYEAGEPPLRAALPFVYRLSLLAGILTSQQDPTLDELARKCQLLWEVDPAKYGFVRPSKIALKQYIRNIGKHSGITYSPPMPKQSVVDAAWADLRISMRSHGKRSKVNCTSYVSKYALKDQLTPAMITPVWIKKTERSLSGHHRRTFRSGIFVLDALLDDTGFPNENLPSQVSGLVRERRQPKA
ncbi:hypothetical protein [Phaeobacter inhibens]|uniref:hypothetical protein n=1 Tax=Phaeobacter inhibens TaxID=221822 RepID=UPI000F4861ED|nr:hypothetical protein [Phaeobacter inhibens]